MKLRTIELEATPEELDASTVLADLVARLTGEPAGEGRDEGRPVAPVSFDGTAATPTPSGPSAVPGVAPEGQNTVRDLLSKNPARDHFVAFLTETTMWPEVHVHGIKPKGAAAGAPLDYSRYLRLRKTGSQLGGFAYVYAVDGLCSLRLNFDSDQELHAIAPDAWRTPKGHREYGVGLRIVDEPTLRQALELARLAYDRT